MRIYNFFPIDWNIINTHFIEIHHLVKLRDNFLNEIIRIFIFQTREIMSNRT